MKKKVRAALLMALTIGFSIGAYAVNSYLIAFRTEDGRKLTIASCLPCHSAETHHW